MSYLQYRSPVGAIELVSSDTVVRSPMYGSDAPLTRPKAVAGSQSVVSEPASYQKLPDWSTLALVVHIHMPVAEVACLAMQFQSAPSPSTTDSASAVPSVASWVLPSSVAGITPSLR